VIRASYLISWLLFYIRALPQYTYLGLSAELGSMPVINLAGIFICSEDSLINSTRFDAG